MGLVRRFKAMGGKRIVVAGTCYEYDIQYGYCNEERTPCMPETLYGVSKNALYRILEQYCMIEHIDLAWNKVVLFVWPEAAPRSTGSVCRHIVVGWREGEMFSRSANP